MDISKLGLMCVLAVICRCQLPEDDEVNTAMPGYTHRVYSGTSCPDARLSGHQPVLQGQVDPLCLLLITEGPRQGSPTSLACWWPWLFRTHVHDARKRALLDPARLGSGQA